MVLSIVMERDPLAEYLVALVAEQESVDFGKPAPVKLQNWRGKCLRYTCAAFSLLLTVAAVFFAVLEISHSRHLKNHRNDFLLLSCLMAAVFGAFAYFFKSGNTPSPAEVPAAAPRIAASQAP